MLFIYITTSETVKGWIIVYRLENSIRYIGGVLTDIDFVKTTN